VWSANTVHLAGISGSGGFDVSDVHGPHRKNMEILDGTSQRRYPVSARSVPRPKLFPIWRADSGGTSSVFCTSRTCCGRMINGAARSSTSTLLRSPPNPGSFPRPTHAARTIARPNRDRREHFALLVDEYGFAAGLATLEDILEVIFGSIARRSTHHDRWCAPTRRLVQPTMSDGWTTIRDFEIANGRFEASARRELHHIAGSCHS